MSVCNAPQERSRAHTAEHNNYCLRQWHHHSTEHQLDLIAALQDISGGPIGLLASDARPQRCRHEDSDLVTNPSLGFGVAELQGVMQNRQRTPAREVVRQLPTIGSASSLNVSTSSLLTAESGSARSPAPPSPFAMVRTGCGLSCRCLACDIQKSSVQVVRNLLLRVNTAMRLCVYPSSQAVHGCYCRWRRMQKSTASHRPRSHRLGATRWRVGWGTLPLSSMPHQLSLKMQLIRNSFLIVQARAVTPPEQAILRGSL